MLQLKPLRAYFAGEVVAIEAAQLGASDGYVYAEVDRPLLTAREQRATGASNLEAQLALRIGGARAVMHVLPLHVHSFGSRRRAPLGIISAGLEGDSAEGASASAPVQTPSEQPAAPTRSSAELVSAVASVLRQAGVPVGLETQQLLESNLELKREVTQIRSDLEERSIEANRARETIEANERVMTCQICFQRRVNIALHSCGHMLCSQCGQHVERCPYCRGEITGSTRLRW